MSKNTNAKASNAPKAKKRKLYFRILKKLMSGRYKEPRFVYLGEEITSGGLILSNHEGTDAPMSLEMYLDRPLRMWGASEMNSGLIQLYKYQTLRHMGSFPSGVKPVSPALAGGFFCH